MKRIFLFAASLLILAACFASAETTYQTKVITVSDFSSVECKIPCDIEYKQGPASFKIKATENILKHLVVVVNDGKLKICLDKTKLFKTDEIEIKISSSELNLVDLNGAIEFEIESGLDTDVFQANLNGSSKLEIKGLDAEKAAIVASGAASMEIEKSKCGTLETTLQGAGSFDLKEVVCNKVKATVSGAGDCDIVDIECERLEVTVNGAGGSTVTGHAKIAKLTVNGVGGINAKQLKADAMDTSVNGIGKISR